MPLQKQWFRKNRLSAHVLSSSAPSAQVVLTSLLNAWSFNDEVDCKDRKNHRDNGNYDDHQNGYI